MITDESQFELGWKAGRAATLKEIADEIALSHDWQLDDPRINYVDVQMDKYTYRMLKENS